MTTAAQRTQASRVSARTSSLLRNASLLSAARLFTQNKHAFMNRTSVVTRTLLPRQQQQQDNNGGGGNSQSLTFGFAFMAILITLLFLAHFMQRVANRRQQEVLERMAMLQDARDLQEVPKLWDVHLDRKRCSGESVEERLGWKDIQPLSAQAVSPDTQGSAEPHDRPDRVSVIIAMPASSVSGSRRDSGKCLEDEYGPDGLSYYEIGVATVK